MSEQMVWSLRTKVVPSDKQFHTANGSLPSIPALLQYLTSAPDDVIMRHLHKKNDFADWIEHAIGEKELADSLRLSPTKSEQIRLLSRALFGLDDVPDFMLQELITDTAPMNELQKDMSGYDPADEQGFNTLKDKMVKRNEALDSKYDDVVRRMKESLIDLIPKDVEKRIEKMKNEYDELRAKISEARRTGKDMLIPTLVLRQFPPKLQLAQVTRKKEDFDQAELTLQQGLLEYTEALKGIEINVRKDVLALAGIDEDGKQKETVKTK